LLLAACCTEILCCLCLLLLLLPSFPGSADLPFPLCPLPALQVKDLSQQVARLVHEVQVLQSGLPAEAAGGAGPGQFGGGNASDVTTQRLVEFKDIEVSGRPVQGHRSQKQEYVSAVRHLHPSQSNRN
jgi:hypothetical protein